MRMIREREFTHVDEPKTFHGPDNLSKLGLGGKQHKHCDSEHKNALTKFMHFLKFSSMHVNTTESNNSIQQSILIIQTKNLQFTFFFKPNLFSIHYAHQRLVKICTKNHFYFFGLIIFSQHFQNHLQIVTNIFHHAQHYFHT